MSKNNYVKIVGNVGQEVSTFTANNKPGKRFSLAVSERYFNRQSNQWENSPTQWFSIVKFNANEDYFKEITKGKRLVVEGVLHISPKSQKDGKEYPEKIEIYADNIWIVDTKREGGKVATTLLSEDKQQTQQDVQPIPVDTMQPIDDLPF